MANDRIAQDLIVVVPGITGTALRREGQTVWDLSVAAVGHGLARTASVLDAMRLPCDVGDSEPDLAHRLEPAGIILGWHLWPGFWAGSGYGRLLKRLDLRDSRAPSRVVSFGYDWRLSNRASARQLDRIVDKHLNRWRQQRGHSEDKVIYICHSMGGLVARYYLEVLGGRETARRLITIGTPYSGSIKAIKALSGGLIPKLPRLGERLAEVARTMPAVAQLLPTYNCIQTNAEVVDLGTLGLPDLPTAAVSDAFALRAEINDAVARNGPASYELHAFGGRRQPTDQSVSLTSDGLRYHQRQRGVDHAGDGTVPLFSSVPPEHRTTATGIFHASRHSALQRNDLLIDQVIDKVNDVDLGATLAPGPELALDMTDFAVAGTDIPVIVRADTPDLLLHASIHDLDGVMYDEAIPLSPDGVGAYTAILRPPAGTWHVKVADVADISQSEVGDLITVASPRHDAW